MRSIAQDIKMITNAPLIVCSTGRTTISATRVIFTKTDAEMEAEAEKKVKEFMDRNS